MTGAVAASLTLVVVLLLALDRLFRGEVSVSPEAYANVVHGWGPALAAHSERQALTPALVRNP
ncbi:MAG TPA: hypothetical protein VE993_05090 [Stellaceae bacterium]|nr:hypothetical protein [Stellaceae bacterium]